MYANDEDKEYNQEHSYSMRRDFQNIPEHLLDHNYDHYIGKEVSLDQQFADDIGRADNSEENIEKHVNMDSEKLKKRNLSINKDKTEKYKISIKSDDEWKKCKYLGTILDTENDIIRRKQLSMAAYQQYKHLFESKKLSLKVRMRLLNGHYQNKLRHTGHSGHTDYTFRLIV